jgi:hypothetical protein
MRIDIRLLVGMVLLAVATFACDTREDPNLLNPPPPDSSFIRVVNLVPDEPVDVSFPFVPVIKGLPSLQVSDYHRALIPGVTLLQVSRPGRPHPDTLANQSLAQGAKITYFVLGTKDTSLVVRALIGKQDSTDIARQGQREITFINGIADSGSYFIKVGCQSGDRLFDNTSFGQTPYTVSVTNEEVSLYLFNSRDTTQVLATAHLVLNDGITTYLASYLIAAKENGVPKLFLLREEATAGPLQEAPEETRTTASVELLNGLAGSQTISASIEGSSTSIATGVAPLSISQGADIVACLNPGGDNLIVSSSAGEVKTPIHLTVGSRTLVAVYTMNDAGAVGTVTLTRDLPANPGDSVHIRGLNLATHMPSVSVAIGAGAPGDVAADSRPFGTLKLGGSSGYVAVPIGNYPFMLSDGSTGKYLAGGIENLSAGYYTVVVAEDAGVPVLLIVRDDLPGATLHPIAERGSRGIFFSMLTDVNATFSTGPLVLPALAYSYVYTTVLPFNTSGSTTISSNAGTVAIDPTLGNFVIGATGSGSNKRLIAFRAPDDSLPPNKAGFHVINALPDGPQVAIRIDDNKAQAVDTAAFGTPTPMRLLDARQYSMFVTAPGDTTILARTDGVELSSGRRYLLVIGPKHPSNTSPEPYELLWVQE